MLLELKVSNFAIIDNIHMHFASGLNILSGETGAGKSILIKSLGLLMGEKAATESVRDGAENAMIEGSFDLANRPDVCERLAQMGIDASDQQMIVRRIVASEGKSRVYINESLSTLGALREVVAPMVETAVPLIEMTGQHENRNLISKSYQLDVLDQYAGIWKERLIFTSDYQKLLQLRTDIDRMQGEARNRAQRLDFLLYQRDEIRALDLQPGEDEKIESETRRLKHSSKLGEFAKLAEGVLFEDEDSVTSRLKHILSRANELSTVDATLASRFASLQEAKTLIDDMAYEIRDYASRLETDPDRQSELEGRLSSLRQLQKKYGPTANEIFMALEQIEAEIATLENSDETVAQMQAQLKKLEDHLMSRAQAFHKKRAAACELLALGVNDQLRDLNMKGLLFTVRLEKLDQLNSCGFSAVEFMTQATKSEPPRALAKFASGGELSRILLSLKQVVGAGGLSRTYLFDEVDTGVSGPTAEKVGRKLKQIAKGQQVICVTHLPQVASFGDVHFFIHKTALKGGGRNLTEVRELKSKERVAEIARLISGEKISKTSLAHAQQLLQESKAAAGRAH